MTPEDHDSRKDGRKGRGPQGPRKGKGQHRGPYKGDRRDGGRRDGGHADRGKGFNAKGPRRDDRRGKGAPRGKGDFRPKADDRGKERKETEQREFTLTIPSTPQKILFKGVDCEINGRKDLAMVLYLHGAAQLSGGCESNAVRMLREMGPGEFATARGRAAKSCPEDAMVALDYLCSTIDDSYDRSFIESKAADGDGFAIYCLIRLGLVDGDDPMIDTFAGFMDERERMVEDGLKLLVRKKDSERAQRHLDEMAERRKQRQTIRTEFIRSMKGDRVALRRMNELASKFPEAEFLRGYLETDDREQWIRDGMGRFTDTIMSLASEFGISDTPFGKYLAAKKLQIDGEDWIPSMISAATAGSEDAVTELLPAQGRKDVRKGLAAVYLARGDAAGIVRYYDGEDTTYLDRYCLGSPQRTVEVARLMGGSRGIDWLKRGYENGMVECRQELVSMAKSCEHGNKQLVYALHDTGEDLEAAKLYFRSYGDRAMPSVKWLSKVCEDERAKEYVRSRFEEMGDMATFESIFVDDGYENRGRRHDNRRPRRS